MACLLLRRTLLSAVLGAAGVAAAQPSSLPVAGPPADPLDARADVPTAAHRSPLAGYRSFAEQAVGNWREANETVTRIGGWRQYAREAQQPAPAAARGADPGVPAQRAP